MRQFYAVVFSLLMLLSSAGISISTHFCCQKIVAAGVTLGNAHLDCGMQNCTGACSVGQTEIQANCCNSHVTNISLCEALEDYKVVDNQFLPKSLIHSSRNIPLIHKICFINSAQRVPCPKEDIYILVQSFLI